ncbi:hypothetical protein ZEAMMB73_Zm00001d016847 [Zea mays]|uniref:Uncharacterized protein n=1 Tax=Zea mays TaxID=4577 RepID=A0A1D6HAS2_MAIZE|nr:hypothetical protein ZEAMMB73_Zm00001d016847 [Zea mays]
MTNRTTTLNLKTMAAQHSWDLFGMKNLVTTMIPQLDSIMMELLVFTLTATLEFGIHMINRLNSMSLVNGRIRVLLLCHLRHFLWSGLCVSIGLEDLEAMRLFFHVQDEVHEAWIGSGYLSR